VADAICAVRRERGIGPHQIAWLLKLPRSTIYAVLKRNGLNCLAHLHRVTREVIRYERHAPGELLHLDVKKLARIPQGGGRWAMPRARETNSGPRKEPGIGYDFLHVAIDDYSRVAFVEAFNDEKGTTTADFLEHALAFFTAHGVRVQRILTDNALNYGARPVRELAQDAGIRLKRTRPFRPQTNGKAEAFNKILQNEWAYRRHYDSNDERMALLPSFLAYYNHDRPHGGIGGVPPASRL
jgi:transposase InsO family protein